MEYKLTALLIIVMITTLSGCSNKTTYEEYDLRSHLNQNEYSSENALDSNLIELEKRPQEFENQSSQSEELIIEKDITTEQKISMEDAIKETQELINKELDNRLDGIEKDNGSDSPVILVFDEPITVSDTPSATWSLYSSNSEDIPWMVIEDGAISSND
ncbi:hypothetical protein [Vallitalea okinawensis]|uniref:hypothetical protein n=1 Tax=Vallitalea okinawensis TaxID=2078660 RepID=UPI000CFDDE22|nr:hypothetical protein [Vallitalea okinawensis]